MIKYPAQLDDSLSLPLVVDNNTPIQADVVNRLRNAIIALETELGVKPSSIYSTVRARLDYLEGVFGSFDFIRLDQDLGGSVTLPKVIGIQGRPISSATPNTSDVLAWNGIAWAPTTPGSSIISFNNDLSGSSTSQTVIGIQNRPIDSTEPITGQTLVWNGVAWIPDTNFDGSLRIVNTLSDRDNIPALSRIEGMFVKVLSDGIIWTLSGGITNDKWIKAPIVPNVAPQELSDGLTQDFVKLVATRDITELKISSPLQSVVDGYNIYISQYNPLITNEQLISNKIGTIYKLTVNEATITAISTLDLQPYFPSGYVQVRDLAQDSTYLYATTYDSEHVAIINKSTFSIVGWTYVGSTNFAVGVTADNSGHFYVTTSGTLKRVNKYTTSNFIGQNTFNAITADGYALNGNNLDLIEYGNSKLWIINSSGPGDVLYKVDASTMSMDASLADIGGNADVFSVLYNSNYVWVGCGAGEVYKLNPTTLAVMPTYPIIVDAAGSSVFGLGIGPDDTGVADSTIVAGTSSGILFSFYPGDGSTVISGQYPCPTGSIESIVSIGNFIYLTNPITKHIDYYCPVTGSILLNGFIETNRSNFSWKQQYSRSGGDIVDGYNIKKVNSLFDIPLVSSAASTGNNISVTTKYISKPTDLIYDGYYNKIWFCDNNESAIMNYDPSTQNFKRIYFKDANTYNIEELYPNNISYPLGLTCLTDNQDYLFCGVNTSVTNNLLVIDKKSGEIICVGISSSAQVVQSVLIAGNYLIVYGEYSLDKYLISDLIGNNKPYAYPIDYLSIENTPNTNGNPRKMAYDGYYAYFASVNGSAAVKTVRVLDINSMSTVGSWSITGDALSINCLLYADGYVWSAAEERIDRLDVSNPLSITNTQVTGIPTGGYTYQTLAYDGTYIWSGDSLAGGTLVLINPSTAAFVQNATTTITDTYISSVFDNNNKIWFCISGMVTNTTGIGSFYTVQNIIGQAAERQNSYLEIAFVPPSIQEVAAITNIYDIDDTLLPNGALVYVNTIRDYFQLNHNMSGILADGITILNTNSGSGKWLRQNIPNRYWQETITEWHIDSAGNDENVGSAAYPIKTHAELCRRVGEYYVPTEDILVYLDSATVDDLNVPFNPQNTVVTYIGTLSTTTTSTVSAATNRDASLNQPLEVTSSGAANFWSSYTNSFIQMTSGASNGYGFWLQEDLNPGTPSAGRMTPCLLIDINAASIDSEGNVSGADTFKVCSFTTVTSLKIHSNKRSNSSAAPINFVNIKFSGPVDISGLTVFSECYFNNLISINPDANVGMLNCGQATNRNISNQGVLEISGGRLGTIQNYNILRINGGTYIVKMFCNSGSRASVADIWSWEWSEYIIFMRPNAYLELSDNYLWGTSSVVGSYAIRLLPQSSVQYTDIIYLIADGAEAYDFAFGSLAATSCRAFDDSVGTFTSSRTLSWTNLGAAIGSGGFGGYIVDPITGATFTL